MRVLGTIPYSSTMDSLFLFRSPIVSLPSYAHSHPYLKIKLAQGSGVGKPLKAVCSSLGESYERNHFFHDIISTGQSCFIKKLPKVEADSCYSFLQQINNNKTGFYNHSFKTTNFVNLANGESRELPSILLDLSHRNSEDLKWLSVRDSTGQAGHADPESSLMASTLEFLERQALILSWLYKRPARRIEAKSALRSPESLNIYNFFDQVGSVKLFDISIESLGIRVVLALFFTSDSSSEVQFAIGSSGGLTLEAACDSALTELWLSYQSVRGFMSNQGNVEDVEELYLREFYKLNKASSRELFSYLDGRQKGSFIGKGQCCERVDQVIDRILSVTKNLYLYTASKDISGIGRHYYTKLFSPDLFFHMNTSRNMNYDNAITRELGLSPPREKRLIPFP